MHLNVFSRLCGLGLLVSAAGCAPIKSSTQSGPNADGDDAISVASRDSMTSSKTMSLHEHHGPKLHMTVLQAGVHGSHACPEPRVNKLRDHILPEMARLVKASQRLLDSSPAVYNSAAWPYLSDGMLTISFQHEGC